MIFEKKNLADIFKDKQEEMIEHALKHRQSGYNFMINKDDNFDQLYQIFLDTCKDRFEGIVFKKPSFKYWGYVLDKLFFETKWHNHVKTSDLVGVFYLKVAKTEQGIALYEGKQKTKKIVPTKIFKPKDYDLIIFKNNLLHRPLLPLDKDDFRLSINMEVFIDNSYKI